MALPQGFTLQSDAAPEKQAPQINLPTGFTLQEPKAEVAPKVPAGFTLQEPKTEEAPAPDKSLYPHKDALKNIGFDTGTADKVDVLHALVGPSPTSDPKVLNALYDQAEKNLDFATTEAQKALRIGATQEQAAEIFANKLKTVSTIKGAGTVNYPVDAIEAAKNAFTRGGLGIARDVANLGALAAGAVGADTTSKNLLSQSQKLEDIAALYPGQFASTQEALAKGSDVENKVKNLAMRAMEGSIENAPSMITSMGGATGAKLLAEKGLEAFAKKYGKQVTENMLEKAGKYGVAAGAFGASTALESGSIYKDIYDETGQLRPAVAAGFGSLAGALDAIVPAQAVNTMAKKELLNSLSKSIVQRYGVDALKNMGEEGATEFVQTFLEKAGVSYVNGAPVFTKANLNEALDAAFIGTFMGGGTHVTAQAIQDVGMKAQGVTRNEAKDYFAAEQEADKAKANALNKWKTKGLTPTQKTEAADAVKETTEAQAEAPIEEVDRLTKHFMDSGHTRDNARLLAEQQIKEAEDARRIVSGTTGTGAEVFGQPIGEQVTGGANEPIGTPVAGAGIPTGTTAEGTVSQPAPLTPTAPLVSLMHASGANFKTPSAVKTFLQKVAPDEVAPLVEADPKIYKSILEEWKGTKPTEAPAMQPVAPVEAAPAIEETTTPEALTEATTEVQPVAEEVVQEEPTPEAPPVEAAPQVSDRERAAAERMRQQQEEAAAEKAAAAEEVKRVEAERLARQAEAEGKVAPVVEEEVAPIEYAEGEEAPTTTAEDADFEKAKDKVGAFVRQKVGNVASIAPEDVVSAGEALAALADIMHHVIKKGARTFADAMAKAKEGLGTHATSISEEQFRNAYDEAVKRILGNQAPASKTTQAAKKTKLPKVKDAILRIERSNNAIDMGSAIGDLIKLNNFDDVKESLADAIEYLDSKRIAVLLPNLTTYEITSSVGKDIPHLNTVLAAVQHMSVMRNKMLANISTKAERWTEFNHKNPKHAKLLNDAMHFARLQRIDFSAYKDLNDAIARDPILADLKKKRDGATEARSRASYQGQVTDRIASLSQGFKLWNELGKVENGEGQKIFKEIKDHYQEMFNLQRAILDERVANAKVPGDINDASTPKGRLMAAIRKTYETVQEEGGVYFPYMRYGTYWLRVGKGEGKEFYMFESEWARDRFERKRYKELQAAGELRTKDQLFEDEELAKGNRMDQSRDDAAASDELLKGVFKAIDSQTTVDKDALKDSVYQLYLMTMPEQSFRKKYVHAKGTTGFNPDALRNFVRAGYTSANQLSKLKYGPEIRNSIEAARASLVGDPQEYKKDMVVSEVEKRVDLEFSPPDEDRNLVKAVNGINQFVFLWRITSPRSALINLTALPNFGLPALAADFNAKDATVALAKYAKVWEHTAVVTPDGKFTPVSVGFSDHVQGNAALRQAFDEAVDREITEVTRTHDILAMGRVPSAQYRNKVSRGYAFSIKAAGFLFHHTERINREIMFMSSFELAYNKYLTDAGKEHLIGADVVDQDAYDKAIEKAVELTNRAMFNYTRFNRPRYMRHTILKPAVQFRMYAQQVTENLTTSFLRMLPFVKGNTAKRAAAKQFFGTLLMVGLEAGIVGLPFPIYWTLVHTLHAIFAKKRKEDEPPPMEEINLDLWFRNEWLPQVFGDYAKPLAKGPISYYSNVDIGSGTSLANIWFRDPRYDPTTEGTIRNMVFDLAAGAAGGVATDFLSGYDDIRKGYFNEGINKFLPAPVKGPHMAWYWSQEGVITKNQMAPYYRKSEVTPGMLLTKSLGFNPTELSIMQEFNYPMKQIEQDLLHQRAEIMDRLDIGLTHHQNAVVQQAILDMVKFSNAYPEIGFTKVDNVVNSMVKRATIRAMADHGLVIDPRLMPRTYAFAKASRPRRSKAEDAAAIDKMVETQNQLEEAKARAAYDANNPDED